MEVLGQLIQKAVEGGFLPGFEVGKVNGLGLMSLTFSMPMKLLLFCDAEPTGGIPLVCLCFEAVSGLKVN